MLLTYAENYCNYNNAIETLLRHVSFFVYKLLLQKELANTSNVGLLI